MSCPTWYLSLVQGTVFTFRVNARATLQHLNDPELEKQLAAEDEKAKMLVGYVRDVSPEGLEIGLLTSKGHAYDKNATIDPANPLLRKGITVRTQTISTRPRSKTHPEFEPPGTFFCNASSWSPTTGVTALPPLQHSVLIAATPALRPTESLPWGRAFAYRPKFDNESGCQRRGQVSTGCLRVPIGARHRFVVGNYSTEGVPARPQTRFSRKEVERAEKLMDTLSAQEDADMKERIMEQKRLAIRAPMASKSVHDSSPSTSSSGSSLGSGYSEESISSDGSFSSVDLSDGSQRSHAGSRSSTSRPLSIVIDVFLDLDSVKTLPGSPQNLEDAVARLENMERSAVSRMASARVE